MEPSKHDPKTVPYLATIKNDGVHCAVCGLLFSDYRELQPHWIERMREEGIEYSPPPRVEDDQVRGGGPIQDFDLQEEDRK